MPILLTCIPMELEHLGEWEDVLVNLAGVLMKNKLMTARKSETVGIG